MAWGSILQIVWGNRPKRWKFFAQEVNILQGLWMPSDQHQRISNYADAAQEHGWNSHQRAQQTTHGYGDANHIVGKSENQILADFFINGAGES